MTAANTVHGGLYLHVPFCRTICPYCDFAVVPDREPSLHARWASALARAVDADPPEFPLRSVYVGGGTPGRIDPERLRPILATTLGPDVREVTLEANPEDVTPARLEAWREIGVSRLSIGVQRLDPDGLRRLGRAASRGAVERLPQMLAQWRSLGGTASVDLIYGLLGDEPEQIAGQVDEVLRWPVDHLSAYALTIEPGTPFGRATLAGRRFAADEDVVAACYGALLGIIEQQGWESYEVSNFCRPGYRAVHNTGYWERRPYIGHGPGAASLRRDGHRWVRTFRHRALAAWLDEPLEIAAHDVLDDRAIAAETLLVGLRSDIGVPAALLEPFRARSGAVVARLFEAGDLVASGSEVRMPPRRRMRAEAVAASWLAALDGAVETIDNRGSRD
ncbi:MAG: coproporphyrinogen III oxidase family protein [Candidatus Dadabacteria bacterium]|nr:MAG: coproporphyrinogen III oxidase family protein [Candidatus Dadabacteria bacterium]